MKEKEPRVLLIKSYRKDGPDTITQPLGLMYLAASVRNQWPGAALRIVDMRLEPLRADDMLRSFRPDTVGISALTVEADAMHQAAAELRREGFEGLIIAGGPHVSSFTFDVMQDGNIDLAVVGEGENTIVEILERRKAAQPLFDIPGTAFRRNGQIHIAEPRAFMENLDDIPWPAWNLTDIAAYSSRNRFSNMARRRYMAVLTSRGCPFHCIFCHKIHGKKVRGRSAKDVLNEMERLHAVHGIEEVEIIDDFFNYDLTRVQEIFRGIRERGMKVRVAFPNALRGDRLDGETLRIMREGGTYFAGFAVETASPRLQKMIRKHINLKKLRTAVEDAVKEGIFCQGFFMLGFPTETRDEMLQTIEFAASLPLHLATFSLVIPYRGTEIYEMASSLGKRTDYDYGDLSITGGANISELSDEELRAIARLANRRFYLRPGQIWRLLRKHPNRRDMVRYAVSFARRAFGSGDR
ncbi:MAG: radical SAM protein [Deltaproteobacteria bacterium]|nr:radical SAM protein [Deltaproteobacteria bacterium]MBW2308399.1 radical SAM protein [Deltaproteobacteria bacterium]